MALDDPAMHRAGLAFLYRIAPVLVATLLYGIYISLLCTATRGLWQRGLKNQANVTILFILYLLFCITSALWALEVAQLIGLVELLLDPQDLSTDGQFNVFYALVARETKLTSVLFESQMIVGDILVIWRLSAIWFSKRILVLIPLFWWGLMIVNMIVGASHCNSGVNSTNYTELCKVTQTLAPVLSVVTNVSVMILTIWKAWLIRDEFKHVLRSRRTNRLFSIFVLLIESGTLYVIMLVTDMLVTSYVVGGNESVSRMIGCISGYSTVQFVAIYPTLMLNILRESIWNSPNDDLEVLSVTRQFTTRPAVSAAAKYTDNGQRSLVPMQFAGSTEVETVSFVTGHDTLNLKV
ncbi:hypothetical protein F5878DRAFT_667326 [Lentinula raphanica]|uniref:Uncharacterized protein n=1 Tax=Lentinula raphanica TaxID=153919 RepID=A0AA38U4Y4_9AGAR|nr:hypothetical protein F5880DRAFT_1475868 [Lentinula raphanica]KAJ3831660.1 hypothetical protein F5878DRAFT_667326 [Lentinula raphanica]